MSPTRPPKSELDKLRGELREKYRVPLAERLSKEVTAKSGVTMSPRRNQDVDDILGLLGVSVASGYSGNPVEIAESMLVERKADVLRACIAVVREESLVDLAADPESRRVSERIVARLEKMLEDLGPMPEPDE